MDAESIDLIVTDPPYGISFMGKDWDKAVPSVEVWKECLRVLKPGAFAFIMSSPRLDVLSQMAIRLQEAGFKVDFTPLYWTYLSGFPKSENISKAVDKKLGAKRETIGLNPNMPISWIGGTSYLTKPATEEAKALDGAYGGFQPKPAVEVIIVAMKPLSEKTYVEQALKNKKGITWLDDGRIPFANEEDMNEAKTGFESFQNKERFSGVYTDKSSSRMGDINTGGRYPANLLVSDDVLNDGEITKTRSAPHMGGIRHSEIYVEGLQRAPWFGDDEGSFSRHFSLDNWWTERIKKLPESVRKTFPFLIVPKASKSERNKELEDFREEVRGFDNFGNSESVERFNTITKNIHPTVKPVKLMAYLITLGSRENEIVLDPFCGSGSTCVAAWLLSRKYVGIEIKEDYVKIARARIEFYEKQSKLTDFLERKLLNIALMIFLVHENRITKEVAKRIPLHAAVAEGS